MGYRGDYRAHVESSNKAQRQSSASVRDIGKIPPIKNPSRRRRAKKSFRYHLEKYHASKFGLGFSQTHLEMIELAEQAINGDGLLILYVVPRGTGKTTIARCAVEYAISHGLRRFPMLICADQDKANKQLSALQMEYETNELLHEDFPEICWPIQKLERMVLRAKGQTCLGKPTYLRWASDEIMMADTPEGRRRGNAGAAVKVGGITSAVRGAQMTLATGEVIRPDLILLDDFQTRESGTSPAQTKTRLETVSGDILGMAGPGKRISVFGTGTKIAKRDAVDQLSDRGVHPEWQSIVRPMIVKWPANMQKWHEYAEIWRNAWVERRGFGPATEFYLQNRQEMDQGSDIYWPQRVDPGCESALQTAMNLWIRDPSAFMAEYQNDPDDPFQSDDAVAATVEQVKGSVGSCQRWQVPLDAEVLVAHCDVQKDVLIYSVTAWSKGFQGSIVDYSSYPQQTRSYWTLLSLSRKISDEHAGGFDASLLAALRAMAGAVDATPWVKSNGQQLKLALGMIDAAWGDSTETVFRFCREYGDGVWFPCFGVGISAGTNPINHSFKPKAGESRGLHYQFRYDQQRQCAYYRYDANFYKSLANKGFLTAEGDPGCLLLHEGKHELFADQFCAEYPVRTQGRGRVVTEWKLRPGSDNHYLDNVAACCAGGVIKGIVPPGTENYFESKNRRKRKIVSRSDLR